MGLWVHNRESDGFKLPRAALEEERVVRFVGQAAGVVVRQTHSGRGAITVRDLHDTYDLRYVLIWVTYGFIRSQPLLFIHV